MTDLLTKLKEIDMTIMGEVVKKDLGSPSFEINEWSVKRLSAKGLMNPDGLWLFRGEGSDQAGARPWSVVLKILERQEDEPPHSYLWYWKREIYLAQSGWTERMPGPVKAPRFYRVDETQDDVWLWMEHIQDQRPGTWVLDDYIFAAHQLGIWNGAFLKEMSLTTEPWLARQHYRALSDWNPEDVWHFPLHQKYLSKDIRNRCERLWADREMFYHVLENLPQCFTHLDSNRRNLFIRWGRDGKDKLTIIDWAMCGLGPLGAELYALVGVSCVLSDWPPADLPDLDSAVFESYLQGLGEAGWSGNIKNVRLGYLAWLSMWLGIGFPRWAAWWCAPENRQVSQKAGGLAEEELYLHLLQILYYVLDCADDARMLMS